MKKILYFLLVLLFASAWVNQEGTDPVPGLRQQVDLFNRKYDRLKLDLFFNQPKYAPGDTALVRTLYVSAAELKPVKGRQLVYIDLFDQAGKRAWRNQIMVVNGLASNAMIIPDDLPGGLYLLVAYSDWMRNFDPSLFFRQDFLVTGKESIQIAAPSREVKLDFYPEGGNLVNGVENNLLVHATGNYENAKVVIKGGDSEIASTFDADGYSEVKISPQQNRQYTAELTVGATVRKFDLPQAMPDGFSIEAQTPPAAGPINIKISASANQDWAKRYFLILTNSKGIVWSRPLEFMASGTPALKKDPLEIALPGELPSGITQINVIDESSKIWLQRVIMIGGKTDFTIKVKPSKKIFATREPVKVEIELLDKIGNPVQGHFAARITNQDLFKDSVSLPSLGNDLLLYSDIATTFRMAGSSDSRNINRYLISQTCPWINWDRINSVKENSTPKYLPQVTMTISGKATFLETGQPIPDSSQIMFFLQKQVSGYEITTTPTGSFNCPILFDFAGNDEVFFAASHKGDDLNNVSLQIDKQDTLYGFKSKPWMATKTEDEYGVYRLQKKIIDKSFSFFTKNHERSDSVTDPNAAIEDELQGADLELTVNDFILFPTMEDLIREVLRAVDHRKVKGKDIIRIYTTHKRPTNGAGPLFVIDGVMTKNVSAFLSLKPSETISIKVVKEGNKLTRFGTLGSNGVILIWTKNAGRKAGILHDNIFPLTGMSPQYPPARDFGRRKSVTNTSVPVLKPCLYWVPDQKLNDQGKASLDFTTSDDVGTFKIHIEGITAGGAPIFAEETFQVKYE